MNPNQRSNKLFLSLVISSVLLGWPASAQVTDTLVLKDGLALRLPRSSVETIISPNPIEASLAHDEWRAPKAGDVMMFANGDKREWKTVHANQNGWFEDSAMANCYLYVPITLDKKAIVLLRVLGDDMVYVNGAPRSGNPYGMSDVVESWQPGFDYSFLPVALEKGRNDLLFRCSRGRLKVRLQRPGAPIGFNQRDITVPDFIVGEAIDMWGAIVVANSTVDQLKTLFIRATLGAKSPGEAYEVPVIQALSVRKIPFHLRGDAIKGKGVSNVLLTLFQKNGESEEMLDTVTIPIRVQYQTDNHKETFISDIDGGVQYYGINPASTGAKDQVKALFFSLHGAGVEAVNQSGSYYPKSWGHIVAPTNRRPYGFNWEDWGRLDAIEALGVIKRRYAIDENRIYLTGHSMGGHGVWHVGAMFPDQFAAIGPSAGWISFWSYRFRGQNIVDTSEIRAMIRRSTTPSETMKYLENYRQEGVYVLHGSDDDNVSPEQARSMVSELGKIHKDLIYDEQRGVGHWWDLSDEPGADCVDWAPMFDFFARHARPVKERIREVSFVTSNPGVSARSNWLVIDAQLEQLKMSSATIRLDPGKQRFIGTTKNVARLALDLVSLLPADSLHIDLDGQRLTHAVASTSLKQVWLEQKDGKWSITGEPSPDLKGAHRYGTLKDAFRNRMVFVYGTNGSREENRWSFDKARFDAEKFWYQGNGSVDVIADVDFRPEAFLDRNVIIYGNSSTNRAWKSLLSASPIQVNDRFIMVGNRKISGDDLSCVFVRPRKDSRTATIGIISGTGLIGMKVNNRLPYLNPGIGLPDCTILNSDVLTKGEDGVVMTGFFGLDWGYESGEFVWARKKN